MQDHRQHVAKLTGRWWFRPAPAAYRPLLSTASRLRSLGLWRKRRKAQGSATIWVRRHWRDRFQYSKSHSTSAAAISAAAYSQPSVRSSRWSSTASARWWAAWIAPRSNPIALNRFMCSSIRSSSSFKFTLRESAAIRRHTKPFCTSSHGSGDRNCPPERSRKREGVKSPAWAHSHAEGTSAFALRHLAAPPHSQSNETRAPRPPIPLHGRDLRNGRAVWHALLQPRNDRRWRCQLLEGHLISSKTCPASVRNSDIRTHPRFLLIEQ